jgi:hypothetical protein
VKHEDGHEHEQVHLINHRHERDRILLMKKRHGPACRNAGACVNFLDADSQLRFGLILLACSYPSRREHTHLLQEDILAFLHGLAFVPHVDDVAEVATFAQEGFAVTI